MGRNDGLLDLLERETELAAIERALDSARAGDGSLFILQGGAGLGKTTLVAEARRRARRHGMLVLSATGAELEREHPFGVVVQLLERPLHAASADRRERLLSGSAGLAAPLLLGTQRGEGGEQPLLHGLFWLVQNLADADGALLVVDDAHWADPSSLRFLLYLAHRIEEVPVAVLAAARPSEPGAPAELARLTTHRSARAVTLGQLSEAAVARLVRRRRPAAAPAFVRACATATGGNPFLIAALLDTALRDDAAADEAAAERLARAAPEQVVASVVSRVERLGPAAVSFACALSVLGDSSPLRRVAAVAQIELDAAAEAASALAATGVIRDDAAAAFVHPLLRTAVHETLTPRRRAELHGRAARVLHEEGAPLEQVAASLLHARAEGDPWVVDVLSEAASRAVAEGAASSAASYFRRALEEPPPGAQRTGVLVGLGHAEALSGDPRGVARIGEAIERVEDTVARARISLVLGRVAHPLGRDREGAAALVRALDELDGQDPALALELEAEWMTVARLELSLRPAAMSRLRARARELRGESPLERVLLALEADRRVLAGEPRDTVVDAALRGWAGGRLLEEQTSQSWAPIAALAALAWSDDFDTYEAGLSAVQADARRRGLIHAHANALYLMSFSAYYRGRLADAVADLQLALDTRHRGWREFLSGACSQLAWTLIDQGKVDEAERAVSLPELEAQRETAGYALVVDARARIALLRGRPAEALELLLAVGAVGTAADVFNPGCLPWRSHAALAAARVGDRDQATALIEDDLRLSRRFGAPRPIGVALRVSGLLTGGDAGIEQLREAVTTLERSPAELELCRALVDHGAALRRSGRRRDAREPLRRGLDMAQRFGAAPLEQRARDELLAAGGRPRDRTLTGVDSLTPSERRVATMAADGLTSREIAEALFVTPKAVEWHLRHTYRKLDIPGRDALPGALRT